MTPYTTQNTGDRQPYASTPTSEIILFDMFGRCHQPAAAHPSCCQPHPLNSTPPSPNRSNKPARMKIPPLNSTTNNPTSNIPPHPTRTQRDRHTTTQTGRHDTWTDTLQNTSLPFLSLQLLPCQHKFQRLQQTQALLPRLLLRRPHARWHLQPTYDPKQAQQS